MLHSSLAETGSGRQPLAGALLLLAFTCPGCATHPSILPLLARNQHHAACSVLATDSYFSSEAEQSAHFREVDALARAVAQESAAQLSVHALSAAEVARLIGFAPVASAHYGEQVLLVQATLDARKSRVPVDIEGLGLSSAQDDFLWSSDHVDSETAEAARLAITGAKPRARGGGGGGYAGAGPSFRDFQSLGPFSIPGFMLFHMMTGGLLLLSDALGSRGGGGGGGLYLSRLVRQRDTKEDSRFDWPPQPESAQDADGAAQLIRRMQDSVEVLRGCRAQPGEVCRTYLPLIRRAANGRALSPGGITANIYFHQEPACKLTTYSEWELPAGQDLVDRLNKQEAAGALPIRGPEPKQLAMRAQP